MIISVKVTHIAIVLTSAMLGMAIEDFLSAAPGARAEAKILTPQQRNETEGPAFGCPPGYRPLPPDFFDGDPDDSAREYEDLPVLVSDAVWKV